MKNGWFSWERNNFWNFLCFLMQFKINQCHLLDVIVFFCWDIRLLSSDCCVYLQSIVFLRCRWLRNASSMLYVSLISVMLSGPRGDNERWCIFVCLVFCGILPGRVDHGASLKYSVQSDWRFVLLCHVLQWSVAVENVVEWIETHDRHEWWAESPAYERQIV